MKESIALPPTAENTPIQVPYFSKALLLGMLITGLLVSMLQGVWLGAIVGILLPIIGYVMLRKQVFPQHQAYSMAVLMAVFQWVLLWLSQGAYPAHYWTLIAGALLIPFSVWRAILVLAGLTFAINALVFTQVLGFGELAPIASGGQVILHFALILLGLVVFMVIAHETAHKTQHTEQTLSALQQQAQFVQKNVSYAQQISKGDLDVHFEVVDGDEIGKALREMQSSLRQAAVREMREKYITTGLAEVGEILRTQSNNLEELSYQLLYKLIKYLGANQGAVFLLRSDESDQPYLEMTACYAYDRRKFLKKRFELKEGIVGQAVMEKGSIILQDIPEDYIQIGSGLGDARPRNVAIVPLKNNEEVVGAIEVASFKVLEDYRIAFLEKVSESVAASVLSAQINERTRYLLQQSQEMTEQMRAQEEEMRQNVEELQATQEEMMRKERDTSARMLAIDNSGIASVEFDMTGHVKTANQTFLDLLKYKLDDVVGKHYDMFLGDEQLQHKHSYELWENLRQGITRPGEYTFKAKDGREIYLNGAYSIIRDHHGKPVSVIKLVTDITEAKHLLIKAQQQTEQLQLQEKAMREAFDDLNRVKDEIQEKQQESASRIDALNRSGIISAEFDMQGNFLHVNEHFSRVSGFTWEELQGKNHRLMLANTPEGQKEYDALWQQLNNGEQYQGEAKRFNKDGQEVFLNAAYTVIRDKKGVPKTVLKLAVDITENKRLLEISKMHIQDIEQQETEMRDLLEQLQQSQYEEEQLRKKMESNLRALQDAHTLLEESKQAEDERFQHQQNASRKAMQRLVDKHKAEKQAYEGKIGQLEREINELRKSS